MAQEPDEFHRCIEALIGRAQPWGRSRVDRALEVWPERLHTGLCLAHRPGVEDIITCNEQDRKSDNFLRSWYIYYHIVVTNNDGAHTLPCEVCGRLTGSWCEDCDNCDHAVCMPCEEQGQACMNCPGQPTIRDHAQGFTVYAVASQDEASSP